MTDVHHQWYDRAFSRIVFCVIILDIRRLRGHEGERNNCFSKIQLVGQKYRDKTTLASKTRCSHHCFGFQCRRFSRRSRAVTWRQRNVQKSVMHVQSDVTRDYSQRRFLSQHSVASLLQHCSACFRRSESGMRREIRKREQARFQIFSHFIVFTLFRYWLHWKFNLYKYLAEQCQK